MKPSHHLIGAETRHRGSGSPGLITAVTDSFVTIRWASLGSLEGVEVHYGLDDGRLFSEVEAHILGRGWIALASLVASAEAMRAHWAQALKEEHVLSRLAAALARCNE